MVAEQWLNLYETPIWGYWSLTIPKVLIQIFKIIKTFFGLGLTRSTGLVLRVWPVVLCLFQALAKYVNLWFEWVWVRIPVMTPVPHDKALNHDCFEKSWEGSAFSVVAIVGGAGQACSELWAKYIVPPSTDFPKNKSKYFSLCIDLRLSLWKEYQVSQRKNTQSKGLHNMNSLET